MNDGVDMSDGRGVNDSSGALNRLIDLCLRERLVVCLLALMLAGWGLAVAPFDWELGAVRDPVAVDAIPNLGENQQIVFAEWPGRSPRDVEDQVTYALSSALMGVAGVRDVRSLSMFGFASVSVIFDEDVEFYWSRTRLLEKLGSLGPDTLPAGVQPALGPDATALGQIFWYTLEGRTPDGQPVGGWDLHELRSVQDWMLRFGLLSAEGIAEVASIGGFTREYQVEVDPDALRVHGVTLDQVVMAVQDSNLDVGAGTTEINRVEYLVRGVGLVQSIEDIEQAPVRSGPDQIPVRVKDVARVILGPGLRRGALDVGGVEAVGGVVTVREGFNPRQAIANVKARIDEVSRALPSRAVVNWEKTDADQVAAFAGRQGLPDYARDEATQSQWRQWLRANADDAPPWLSISQLTVVPFYDRTQLIDETLGTLSDALLQQLLVTLVVILVMLAHLRAALAVGLMLPMAVLMAFIAMKGFGVEANIVALAGIAIAIGTIVDMGIIITENALQQQRLHPDRPHLENLRRATGEVASAVVTAIATTVISFLPVFVMTGAEGKLFAPLAYTKTFVLLASVLLALTLVPVVLYWLLRPRRAQTSGVTPLMWAGLAGGLFVLGLYNGWLWVVLVSLLPAAIAWWRWRGRYHPMLPLWREQIFTHMPEVVSARLALLPVILVVALVVIVLTGVWEPLGPAAGSVRNLLFIALLFGGVLGLFIVFIRFYVPMLSWCLAHKKLFLSLPLLLIALGLNIWLGFDRVFSAVPNTLAKVGISEQSVRSSRPWSAAAHTFPGLGREFMPALDEGSFLWMPSTMPHASITEVLEVMSEQGRAIAAIPEVESVVGKAGRAETPLDPAPLSMLETVVNYKSEFRSDSSGRRVNFRYDRRAGEFVRDDKGELIPDRRGRPYRQWRDHIQGPDDIWREIVQAARMPGSTLAPKLQPIETRQLMLQTGMRAAMGVKVQAPDLDSLEEAALQMEEAVRGAPGVSSGTVNADRVVGKPWLEIHVDRRAAARYGLSVADVQRHINAAIGGAEVSRTLEGRERYIVRVRYQRERRQDPEQMARVLVATPDGAQIPLEQVAEIRYLRGPQMIRTENTFLTAYVTFGGQPGWAEVDVVEAVREYLEELSNSGELSLPSGVSYSFAGSYEHQVRAAQTLALVIPLSLGLILLLLYLRFRAVSTALIVFSGVAVAWAGGFVMIWLYGQEWFGNFSLLGVNMRELFQLQPINLSVAVWVGFLALFGIAVDDGVVMATYLKQKFDGAHLSASAARTVDKVRALTVAAASRRVRPCLMTSATTILALLPVLTATGRGADLMIPMAIPTVGGLTFVLLSMFVVPVLYCWKEEAKAVSETG